MATMERMGHAGKDAKGRNESNRLARTVRPHSFQRSVMIQTPSHQIPASSNSESLFEEPCNYTV